MKQQKLRFDSLTSATWKQFETLMGEKGGCGNCWCMYFRLPYKDFQENFFSLSGIWCSFSANKIFTACQFIHHVVNG